MEARYTRLALADRARIETGLDKGLSVRKIAEDIDRSAATVSREVRRNRTHARTDRHELYACRRRSTCVRTDVCRTCADASAIRCAECRLRDCRRSCGHYAEQSACDTTASAPWVCNACRKRRACKRTTRYFYSAIRADEKAAARQSEARCGIAMAREDAEHAISRIRDALSRGLSPYEMCAQPGGVGVSESTVYRWIAAGYGGMTNMELERKVGFRPRRKTARMRPTSHSQKRSYAAFCELADDVRAGAAEMDTVLGSRGDSKCLLTLYMRASHLQLALLLADRTCDEVAYALETLSAAVGGVETLAAMCSPVLTDNGCEFADELTLASALGERSGSGTRLYYCDVRASQQKGGCEKNHSELRQILPKGSFRFDALEPRDCAVAMSHINSNPRRSLCGMTPIAMFKAAYGDAGESLLDALGVEEVPPAEVVLKPIILNIERERRGCAPLARLK